MERDEWLHDEDVLIDEPLPRMPRGKVIMNLVNRESRDRWKRRAQTLLRIAKNFRSTADGWLELYQLTQRYLSEAREERDEAEDSLSKALARIAEVDEAYVKVRKQRDDKNDRLQYNIGARLRCEDRWLNAVIKVGEARWWATHFKRKSDERGDLIEQRLLDAASTNRQRRELLERKGALEENEWYLRRSNRRLIAVLRNTRTSIQAHLKYQVALSPYNKIWLEDISKALGDHIAREENDG